VTEKLRQKLGREPTEDEITQEKAKKAEKKRKAQERETAAQVEEAADATEMEAGGAATAAGDVAAVALPAADSPPDAAASSGEQPPAKKPRKPRTPKATKATKADAAAAQSLAAAAANVHAAGARAVAKAIAKASATGLESDAFIDVWRSHASGVRAFMSSVEATLSAIPDDRMTEEQRTEVIADLSAQLSLPFTPPQDIVKAANEKLAAEEAKQEAARKAKAAKAAERTPKSPKVDEAVRAEAYEVLEKFKYDVMDASEKASKGYLSTAHLRQLAIDKGVWEGGEKNNRMPLIKALLPAGTFAAERGGSR